MAFVPRSSEMHQGRDAPDAPVFTSFRQAAGPAHKLGAYLPGMDLSTLNTASTQVYYVF